AGDAERADAAAAAGGAVGAEAPAPPGRPAARRLSLRGALALAADRRFALFLLAVSAVTASHAVYYVYGSIHWRSLGYSEPVIGRLWAWGVFAEIGLFWLGRSVMGRVRPEPALAIAAAAAAARWSAMTLDPGLAALAALQTLHAGSFALAHLAALAFIAEHAPPSARAAAQGLMSAAAGGLAMALAVEGAAALYPAAGAGAYWLGAAFAAVGVAAALALWRGRRRGGGAGGGGLSSARSGPLDGA
ncbi:MAG: MFS transporter, partial [Pseudomonadota bacterium]